MSKIGSIIDRKHVFRYNVGSQVILFDGSGTDYLCMISSLRNLGATASVLRTQPSLGATAGKKNLWLYMALIKKDNFEVVVQKGTEIGVSTIVPLLCEHSEKRKLNMDRLEKIAIEASEQSGRGTVPTIKPVTTLTDLFASGLVPQQKMVLDPTGIPFSQYRTFEEAGSVAVFLGPEGGWSDKELALFKSYNVPVVSMGTNVLRAETAAIAASSLLLLQ